MTRREEIYTLIAEALSNKITDPAVIIALRLIWEELEAVQRPHEEITRPRITRPFPKE